MNTAEPLSPCDPTLAIAERQLVMLAELAEMTMAASRAYTASAIVASKAETTILGEEWFTPEVGRARACGAKDAAESLQKVTRAVRLTLKLEMTVAEIVRDIHAGKITYIGGRSGETPAVRSAPEWLDRRRPAGPSSAETPDRERPDRDRETLVEFDRPDAFPRAAFGAIADIFTQSHAGEDVGVREETPRSRPGDAGVPAGSADPDGEGLSLTSGPPILKSRAHYRAGVDPP